MNPSFDERFLLGHLAKLTRLLSRVPVQGDLLLARRNDPDFPSPNVFHRLGNKAHRASRVLAYCAENVGFDDVAGLWRPFATTGSEDSVVRSKRDPDTVGYVYLLKHGARREYKIGRTSNPLRREGELGIQLPERCEPMHYIKTDDAEGIEAYWHRRFAAKRKGGEWFALTVQDVQAFKLWRRIY